MMVKRRPSLALLVIWSMLILPTNQTSRQKRQILADQPRLITENGHLIFQSGTNHNITFRGGESSGFFLNNIDLKVALTQVAANKANIVSLQANMSSVPSNLTNRLSSLETVINGPLSTVHSQLASLVQTTGLQSASQSRLETRVDAVEDSVTTIRSTVVTAIPQIRRALQTIQRNANSTGGRGGSGGRAGRDQIQNIQRRLDTLENSMRQLQVLLSQNECQSNPCINGGTCVDMYNGYLCRCPQNWQGPRCTEDVNECAMYAGTDMGCQNGATCTNTQGSFSCLCPANWYGIHCRERHNDCAGASHAELCGYGTCVDETRVQPGQPRYRCICDAGWTNSPTSPACTVDIDECVSDGPRCSVNPTVMCRNIPGSFLCESCPPGYAGNGFTCYDINECLINNGGCSTNPRVECVNTFGSRSCGRCPEGYEDRAGVCVRVSDSRCSTNNGGCHTQATCVDNHGGFGVSCLCPERFAGSGHGPQGCVPSASYGACHSNPCQNGASCSPHGQHQFTCHCAQGYSGQTCNITVNPCASNPCLHGGNCIQQGTGFICECTVDFTGLNCGVPQQECGGPLNGERGPFKYPRGSVGYQSNQRCDWVITTTPGKVLSIIFTNFSVEGQSSCNHDYLQINDGPDESAKLISRYCDANPLNGLSINSTQNQVFLRFHSDFSRNGEGFTFNWTSHERVCGGNLRDHGNFISPGYPVSYPHNTDCVWTISVSPGSFVSIHFVEVALEHHPNCLYDYLEIRDGETEGATLLVRFCQSETPPSPIQTSGPFAFVRFHTDGDTSDRGFSITYAATTDGAIPGCGGNLTQPFGTIISPGYPTSYRRNMLCVWNIWAPTGFYVSLTFESFDLQTTTRCTADSLVIRDGDNQTATSLGSFCGSTIPAPIRSSNNVMYLELRSDGHVSGRGFKAQWNKACGGTYTGSSGQIQSPGWPNIYPVNADCEYIIQVPSGGISLSFNSFDLEDNNCQYDYVEVYNDMVAPGNLLGDRLCATNRRDDLRGSSSQMVVKFVTDDTMHGTGFQATYTAIGGDSTICGDVLNQNSGTIGSPQHPIEYPHGINCTWYITVDPGLVIKLSFQRFSFEGQYYGNQCIHDYLEVYDNSTMFDGSSFGRFCGTNAPVFLTSTDNVMVVYMKTDEGVSREGFLATFVALNQSHLCGGDLRREEGVVKSPNYPGLYPHDRECEWTITVPEGRQILVNITDFELEGPSPRCPHDYLDIRNGGYLSSPVLHKSCGNQPEVEPLISHSNRLYLKFKSDHSIQRRGFRLEYSSGATGCGGLLTTPTGGFVSPNYPGPYNHNSECFWTIIVAQGSKIILTFIDLDVESFHRQCHDYIEIRDGGQTGRLISKLCGTNLPLPITSNTNKMWIKYSTDHNFAGRGFRAQYYTDCNTKITGQYGVIESSNFPNNYPHSQNCTWTIEVPLGNNINVSFAAFILEYHPNCPYDYLKITDGSNTSLLCGPGVPQPFRSSNNLLKINLITDSSESFTGFRLEWIKDGCGGKLTTPTGGFTSPGYPSHYPHQVICTWEIEVELGMSVELTLHTFDLETSSNCTYDVLEVHAGSDREGFLLSKICHRQSRPQVVTASGNTMFIYFESDISVHGTGFNATYNATPNGCGGKYSARHGFISSKNFPEPYDHNSVCEWLITVEPSHVVALTFLNFGLEGHNCRYDYVDVYDGNSTDGALLGRYCDVQIPPAVRSLGNQMFIKMVSDYSQNHQGYKAEYRSACGGNLNADVDGEITSPLYPNQIEHNSECVWIISSSSNTQRVNLHFTSMDIGDYMNCSAAWVTVTDGIDALEVADGELENRFCGSSLPASITSRGSSLRVYFKSGRFARGKGFRAVYSSAHSSCGGNTNSLTGRFISPLYPDNYPDDIECVWQINTSPGNALQLSFPIFELTGGLNDDYLEIRTPDVNGQLVGRWAGQDRPSNLTNFFGAWIKFRTNEMDTSRGFTAEWSASIDIILSGNSGQIASPNFPLEYPPSANYRWTIQVEQNITVRIRFLAMALELLYSIGTCPHDYVEFFDGGQATGSSLGRFCGVTLPEPFVSTSNEVTVVFASDGYLELTGFLFTWEAVLSNDLLPLIVRPWRPVSDCGGNLIASNVSQELTTPGYPNAYTDNLDCYWTVFVPVGYRVVATIQNISIETNSRCTWDYIQFLDGNSQYSAVIGSRYCKPDEAGVRVQSTSNFLTIHFHTDFNQHDYPGVSIRFQQGCGGYITASNGIISSPNYPADYPSNQNCTWRAIVASGKTIGLTFDQHFNIADTGFCSNDYLKLLNGYSLSSPALIVNGSTNTNGTYCGVTAPQGLVTSSNDLFVQFVSDGAGSGDGFSFNFSEISLACGEHLRLTNAIPSGYFMSPNHPQNYPHNVDCSWLITAPLGERIKIDFEDSFFIETTEGCTWDYLAFHDGGTLNAPRLGQHLCGSTLPGTVLSTEHTLFARFRTDNSMAHSGFKAKYSIATCGFRIHESNGVIKSPNYPENYRNNQECEWFIVGPTGHYIIINITNFNIQSSENCTADVLEIRDGNATDTSLFRNCGHNNAVQSIETSDNKAYVRFKSDGSHVASGFRIVFQASLEECGGQQTTPSGILSSPNFPGLYGHKRRCQWIIVAIPGRSITLTFTHFNLEAHPDCLWDYVEIYNGKEDDSPSFGRFCNNVIPGQIQSSGNEMKVVFKTDESESFTGFRAVYTSDSESECGGDLTERSGVIASPLTNNSQNRQCIWRLNIYQPNQTSVQITFGFLRITGQPPCTSDFLEVREGLDNTGALVNRYCGQITPNPIILPSTDLWLRYKTSRTLNEGFNLTYEYTNCGGIYTDNDGVISSPNFPVNNNQNISCAWKIIAPEGIRIRINFTDFDFPLGCNQENLTLQNGGYFDSPNVGIYCNQSRPRNFVSQSNALRLIMINGISAINRKGFRMTYTFESGGCSVLYHDDSGVIRSPNYPRSYPHNVECRWEITVSLGNIVKLKFQPPFDLEASNCFYDHVEVYDVSWNGSLSLLGSYCSNINPPDQRSSSNKMVVIFRSDVDTNGNGFSANWSAECGGVFTSEIGTLYSPGYPQNYPNNANCIYTIKPPDNKLILLTFEDLALQGGFSRWCYNDYVEINPRGGSNMDYRNHWMYFFSRRRFCGTSLPQPIASLNQMIIQFKSDSSGTMRGFRAQYDTEDCGGNLTDPSGTISSGSFHNSYSFQGACTWSITVETNKIVILKILFFMQSTYWYCSYHYLTIYDGSNDTAPQLARVCGDLSTIPYEIKSSSNSMFLKLVTVTSYFMQSKGFQASYSSTYGPSAGCGGTRRQSSGTIRSLDIDNNGQYEPDLNCEWLIYVGDNKIVTINITGINIAGQSNCQGNQSQDQLTIYEGESKQDMILGNYCQQTSDQYLTAGSNVILVVFKTDSEGSAAGFTATFGERDPLCGGVFNATSEEQIISSPNYPNYFNQVIRCNWFIDSGSRRNEIKIEVTDLQLEACSVTDGSSLSVSDKPMLDAGQIVHSCGTSIPSAFYSTGQQVKIVYNVPTSSNSKFQLKYSTSGCNRTYTQSNARITSPGFPSSYQPNLRCFIQYQAPANTKLAIYFRRFNMENHSLCDWDYLEILNSSSQRVQRRCGSTMPNPIFLSDNIATLYFKTDDTQHYAGFDITVISSTAGPGCGGEISETRFGVVTSPNYPTVSNTSQTCSWLITPPLRTTLYFKFSSLSSLNGTCDSNYVAVYQGTSTNEHLLGRYCNEAGREVLFSTQIFLQYVSPDPGAAPIFKFEFAPTLTLLNT